MFITVTPNPSFDQTLQVETLVPGDVHAASKVTLEAGGKGINVARALALAGIEAAAVFPGGGQDGEHLSSMLDTIYALSPISVPVDRPIRVNTTIIEDGGRTTKVNERGAELDDAAQAEVIAAVNNLTHAGSWVAVCGSLPPGVDADFATRLHAELPGDTKLAIDASGAALRHAVEAGCDLIKPNHEELEELVGRELLTLGDVIDVATELHEGGVGAVVVSLGGDGALLVDSTGIAFGTSPVDQVGNTVGAGDAFLAGFLAGGASGITALSEALAWGRAAVSSPLTAFPPATDFDRAAVTVTTEPDRALSLAS